MLAEVDESRDARDGVGIKTVSDEVVRRTLTLDVGFDDEVEDFVGRERVLVSLVLAKFGAGRLFDGVDGDHDAVAVEVACELPDAPFGEVCDGRESAAHVAVEGAVADSELRLVARGQQEGVVEVCVGHEKDATDAGLEVLFGESEGLVLEGGLQRVAECDEGRFDGDGMRLDAEVLRERGGVVEGALGGEVTRHEEADDIVGA